ncbi:TRAP transporter small permease subunit [Rhodobacterales bacterium HKCCE2091]|nr:TRAP transporter small permease subunit [Rhodobacterales bacterium HKCCE2091]
MRTIGTWIMRLAEGLCGVALLAMFCTFLLQIYSRYVMVQPFGWTLELCLTLWIWIVFFGCSFIVRDRDHVTFDILYLSVPPGPRKVFALISAAAIAVGLAASLVPTWDWIDFLKIRRSPTLRIPLRTVFSVYALFLIVVSLRYAWGFIHVLRHGAPTEAHEIHVGEEG